jgi:hypothetical protein
MHWDFPPPAECFLEREPRIVKPALVEEFGGAIWPTGPRQRGNGVDHHPKLVFRSFDFREHFFQLRNIGKGSLHLLHASMTLLKFALITLRFDLGCFFRLSSVSEFL